MIYTRSQFLAQPSAFSPFAQQVVQNFCENISKNDFPCYFAKNVISKDSVYFSFLEKYDNQSIMFEKAAQERALAHRALRRAINLASFGGRK